MSKILGVKLFTTPSGEKESGIAWVLRKIKTQEDISSLVPVDIFSDENNFKVIKNFIKRCRI